MGVLYPDPGMGGLFQSDIHSSSRILDEISFAKAIVSFSEIR